MPVRLLRDRQCRCRDTDVKKYQQKLSGPILDRIDLQVEMDRLSTDERFAEAEQDVSPRLRAWVEAARDRQMPVLRHRRSLSTPRSPPDGSSNSAT